MRGMRRATIQGVSWMTLGCGLANRLLFASLPAVPEGNDLIPDNCNAVNARSPGHRGNRGKYCSRVRINNTLTGFHDRKVFGRRPTQVIRVWHEPTFGNRPCSNPTLHKLDFMGFWRF